MICLAVETSGRIGSVALGRNGDVLETSAFSTARRHAVELLPTVRALCRKHDVQPGQVEEVYVSGGPGSFTGLRIGITFAKTIALGGRTRVVRVPTLEVIAQNALLLDVPPANLAVLLDAKRGRVYAAGFELVSTLPTSKEMGHPARTRETTGRPVGWAGPSYRRTIAPAEIDPADFLTRMPSGSGAVGEGVAYHREAVERSGLAILPETHNQARAEMVYRLGRRQAAVGRYDDPLKLTPIYIRRPEAEEIYERRHAQNGD